MTYAKTDPPTTIQVRSSTRRLLESLKGRGQTYDDVIRSSLEDEYDPAFLAELDRRWRTSRRIPGPQVMRELGF